MEADAPPSGLCFGSRELPIEITWTMVELSDTCQDPLTSRTVNYQSDRERENSSYFLSFHMQFPLGRWIFLHNEFGIINTSSGGVGEI